MFRLSIVVLHETPAVAYRSKVETLYTTDVEALASSEIRENRGLDIKLVPFAPSRANGETKKDEKCYIRLQRKACIT